MERRKRPWRIPGTGVVIDISIQRTRTGIPDRSLLGIRAKGLEFIPYVALESGVPDLGDVPFPAVTVTRILHKEQPVENTFYPLQKLVDQGSLLYSVSPDHRPVLDNVEQLFFEHRYDEFVRPPLDDHPDLISSVRLTGWGFPIEGEEALFPVHYHLLLDYPRNHWQKKHNLSRLLTEYIEEDKFMQPSGLYLFDGHPIGHWLGEP